MNSRRSRQCFNCEGQITVKTTHWLNGHTYCGECVEKVGQRVLALVPSPDEVMRTLLELVLRDCDREGGGLLVPNCTEEEHAIGVLERAGRVVSVHGGYRRFGGAISRTRVAESTDGDAA